MLSYAKVADEENNTEMGCWDSKYGEESVEESGREWGERDV